MFVDKYVTNIDWAECRKIKYFVGVGAKIDFLWVFNDIGEERKGECKKSDSKLYSWCMCSRYRKREYIFFWKVFQVV